MKHKAFDRVGSETEVNNPILGRRTLDEGCSTNRADLPRDSAIPRMLFLQHTSVPMAKVLLVTRANPI